MSSSEHGIAVSQCGNCWKTIGDEENTKNAIKTSDISGIELDIQIIDAICYIYGISLEEFRTWSSENGTNNVHLLTEPSVKLCDSCAEVLSDNYKAHKRFEELSHDSSFVHEINRFRRREWKSASHPKVKTEIEYSSDHGGVGADSFCAFNSEEFEDVPELVPEINCKLEKCEKLDGQLNSINKKKKRRVKKVKPKPTLDSVPVRRSVRTQKLSIKLERLSNEELEDYNLAIQKDSQKKNTGHPGQKVPQKKITKPYECEFCGKTFANRRNFIDGHLPKHYGILEVHCDICGKSLASKEVLRRHKRRFHSESYKPKPKVPCELCGKILAKDSLKSHMQYQHNEVKELKCEVCGKTFIRKEKYDEHLLTHSEGFTPYLCGQCGKTFNCKKILVAHEKTTHVIGNFSCDICSAKFPNKSYLSRHLKNAHVQERKYVCDECGKSFKYKRHLTQHLKLHKEMAEMGGMSIQCDECGKNFKHSRSLYEHKVRNHREDLKKIYQCDLCGRVLSDATCLRTHKKRVHKLFLKNTEAEPKNNDSTDVTQMENSGTENIPLEFHQNYELQNLCTILQ